MTYKMIQVGTGGFGRAWCASFLPPNIADGLIEAVAAVDINPEALEEGWRLLGLHHDPCYTDIEQAFARHKADFCTIVHASVRCPSMIVPLMRMLRSEQRSLRQGS